jgi:hypothetical protein
MVGLGAAGCLAVDAIAAFLVEALGQDHDAVLCGIIARWPDATGAEIEQALATFALVALSDVSPSNENALAATD